MKNKNKNSLIELYRFIFSFNVLKGHGFFPYQGPYFGPAHLSVEFFFILTGFFLVKTLDKYTVQKFFKGLFSLIKDKVKVLGIPLLIGLIFGFIYGIYAGFEHWYDINIWGYLWYICDMFLVIIFYFVIRKFIKNDKIFFAIASIVFLIAFSFHITDRFYSWGYFRAFSSISLGILVSYIPKIKIKHKNLLLIPLILVGAYILEMLLFNFTFVEEIILDILLYPALIYLTLHFDYHNRVFNYLGLLSFGLYAFQNVTRYLRLRYDINVWISFLIIVVLTIMNSIFVILRRKKDNSELILEKNN